MTVQLESACKSVGFIRVFEWSFVQHKCKGLNYPKFLII